jgi:hypothetical protein
MSIEKEVFEEYVKKFKFRELFNELGWNKNNLTHSVVVEGITYPIKSVAEKEGFRIIVCDPPSDGQIPISRIRKLIDTKVSKLFHEHLIIFHDAKNQEQIWQTPTRNPNKPNKISHLRYNVNQSPELLYQRASDLLFELDEEGSITIVDVKKRVSDNFNQNNEKVTKQFYEKFKKRHKAFLEFIKGINKTVDCEWYASLMLNRLMFCYFIQKKGYLGGNKNYLREKLQACQNKYGKNKFYSFYRDFLLALFHQGLGAPKRNNDLEIQLGKVPYLNGGLFDEHELEKTYGKIEIKDKAFEDIFDFFDEYEWHLDTRTTASGKDINPDVVGYIFEKYINDRAQMGAYYTKEDITEYISKSSILSYLFGEMERKYTAVFSNDGEIWQLLKGSEDEYIYPSIKHGVEEEFPQNVAVGLEDVDQRSEWNKPAPEMFALPAEMWREVLDRRNRYFELKSIIQDGKIDNINDFITYNLDIRQFTQDLIDTTENPKLIKTFYECLSNVTILDPTCGSGAFLFAAMNVLEPLYESCIGRMVDFVKNNKGKYKYFEEILQQVDSEHHPNLQYFIYKTIILRNLYGVDIMKEAVEITKLRLFLKLMATVDADYTKPNFGLEPLPDIDFNIRSGNTLVGFINQAEILEAINQKLDDKSTQIGFVFAGEAQKLEDINEQAEIVAKAFEHYKTIQLSWGDDPHSFAKAKNDLQKRLSLLKNTLDEYLALTYQIDPNKKIKEFHQFIENFQPFHWLAEFFEIINKQQGFDVIIGNPPYIEYTKVKKQYQIKTCLTEKSGNIYAFIIERCLNIIHKQSRLGLIVPLSIIATDRTESLQKLLKQNCSAWYANFDTIPGRLFGSEVEQRLTIGLFDFDKEGKVFTTDYRRFSPNIRDYLFQILEFENVTDLYRLGFVPRISNNITYSILKKLNSSRLGNYQDKNNQEPIYIHRIIGYYTKAFDFIPHFKNERDGIKKSEDYKAFYFQPEFQPVILAVINSGLFYWWWHSHSDGFHCGYRDVYSFPFDPSKLDQGTNDRLIKAAKNLMDSLKENSEIKIRIFKKTGKAELQEFDVKKSKHIIDEVDRILASHFSFSPDELDYIINYDYKYRVGIKIPGVDK